jgi:hypothetical protein
MFLRTERLLEPLQLQLPAALFAGGKKSGAFFELRKALDSANCLQPARSPRWIQEPQHSGMFLFDLDEEFAGALNLGDNGRLYVFADTAFVQCL